MGKLATKTFWSECAERGIKTFCQTAVALIGANAIGLFDVDWAGVAAGGALACVISILTSIASLPNKEA